MQPLFSREVIISTLGILYQLGREVDACSSDLHTSLQQAIWATGQRTGPQIFTLPVTLSLMVFFALCMQCGATVVDLP
ncbi:MAG TPA: hypothetical protein DCR55_03635 [Lentisphaeria bacterium]|nr:hypothetical protein [Lentisphaeria bacterium]